MRSATGSLPTSCSTSWPPRTGWPSSAGRWTRATPAPESPGLRKAAHASPGCAHRYRPVFVVRCAGSLQMPREEPMTQSVGPTPDQHVLRVLVVDDAPDIRALLRAMLSERGDVVVLEASGGEEALAVAAAEAPDLAVVDQNMPGMDG